MKDTTPTKVELLQHIQELQDMLAEAQRGAEPVFIIFDGPPGPDGGRFVEVETLDGKSVKVGEWTHNTPSKYWSLGPLYTAPQLTAAVQVSHTPDSSMALLEIKPNETRDRSSNQEANRGSKDCDQSRRRTAILSSGAESGALLCSDGERQEATNSVAPQRTAQEQMPETARTGAAIEPESSVSAAALIASEARVRELEADVSSLARTINKIKKPGAAVGFDRALTPFTLVELTK